MTADQLFRAMEKLELSQGRAARMLGVGERQIRRYVYGDSEIPAPVAKLIRLALAGKLTVKQIEGA